MILEENVVSYLFIPEFIKKSIKMTLTDKNVQKN